MSVCENKEAFQPLIEFANNQQATIGTIKDDINEAQFYIIMQNSIIQIMNIVAH